MVVFINNGWYYPGLSGGDVHVIEVAAQWARRGAVGIAMPRWAYELQSHRLKDVSLFSTGGRFDSTPATSLFALCFRYVLRTLKTCLLSARLVVAGSHYPYDLLPAVIIARFRRRPWLVYVFHLSYRFRTQGARAKVVGWWERIALLLMRSASVIFVDNNSLGSDLVEAGLDPARIVITWNAGTTRTHVTSEQRRPDEVVFCGRITDTKGWRDLLVVGERLKVDCPGVVLRVLGEGDRRRDLEYEAAKRGISDVIRTEGYVSDDVKWSALERATAFVTPSREEGWGIAVSEALDAGADVVAYDLPVYREVHGARRMHVVAAFDVDRLAQAVSELVRAFSLSAEQPRTTGEEEATAARTWAQIADHEAAVVNAMAVQVA